MSITDKADLDLTRLLWSIYVNTDIAAAYALAEIRMKAKKLAAKGQK